MSLADYPIHPRCLPAAADSMSCSATLTGCATVPAYLEQDWTFGETAATSSQRVRFIQTVAPTHGKCHWNSARSSLPIYLGGFCGGCEMPQGSGCNCRSE